jgi:hypothetical protein
MKRLLFVCSVFQYSRETFAVLERFATSGFEVHVLIGWSGAVADAYEERCREAGFAIHRPPARLRYGDPGDDAAPPGEDIDTVPAPLTPEPETRRFRRPLAVLRQARRFGHELLADVHPTVVLGGPYFSCGTFDQGIARAARSRGIPYCCLPVSPYLGERNAVQARFALYANGLLDRHCLVDHSLLGRVLARVARSWWREQDGVALFPWGPTTLLAARLGGLLDPNPWQQPSELYDLCFVESDFSRDLLVGSGYPQGKVVVSGKPLLDSVFERLGDVEHEERVFRSLGLEAGAPFVLCNVEPGYEHRYRSWDEHWERFHEVARALQRTDEPIVLSLHPLCDPRNYRFVEQEYGFRLCEDYKIAELYPYCALSVSFPCSTNLLAALFDKPLVIFDFLGDTRPDSPRAPEYRLPGARFAYSGDELYRELTVALGENDASAAAPASDHGVPAGQRIVDEVCGRFALAASA